MRALASGVTLAAALGLASNACAQDPLNRGFEGPLVAPGASSPTKHAPAHRAKIGTTPKRSAVPKAARLPADHPAEAAGDPAPTKPAAASDPISFGMKWNGTNESGRETRFENLNGGASGTGGEVGLKLHF